MPEERIIEVVQERLFNYEILSFCPPELTVDLIKRVLQHLNTALSMTIGPTSSSDNSDSDDDMAELPQKCNSIRVQTLRRVCNEATRTVSRTPFNATGPEASPLADNLKPSQYNKRDCKRLLTLANQKT
ncbi:hypothetical protein DPEC_G00348770 [Dallia pectoralis]|uniref:Uncharacterized protein n=1 Tax=Dallia pectoralis TaxID=75939 RepID=A0ACC2F1C6_DALPE|nr:hypothetical protein DPEC_G00348770 [Dallia pectoralis]